MHVVYHMVHCDPGPGSTLLSSPIMQMGKVLLGSTDEVVERWLVVKLVAWTALRPQGCWAEPALPCSLRTAASSSSSCRRCPLMKRGWSSSMYLIPAWICARQGCVSTTAGASRRLCLGSMQKTRCWKPIPAQHGPALTTPTRTCRTEASQHNGAAGNTPTLAWWHTTHPDASSQVLHSRETAPITYQAHTWMVCYSPCRRLLWMDDRMVLMCSGESPSTATKASAPMLTSCFTRPRLFLIIFLTCLSPSLLTVGSRPIT